ncbi:MAG TPA: hypothetical protein VIU46_05485 [Gallionellaceae bacterium]
MPKETYELTKDEAQTLNIEELVKFSRGLTVKLRIADTEIGKLRLVIEKLENDQIALTVKLEDASNEVGRLGMVLKYRVDSLEVLKQPSRPGGSS